MKSLCDEICLTADDGRIWFHLKPKAEDFIRAKRGFHRATHDFINIPRVQNLNAKHKNIFFVAFTQKIQLLWVGFFHLCRKAQHNLTEGQHHFERSENIIAACGTNERGCTLCKWCASQWCGLTPNDVRFANDAWLRHIFGKHHIIVERSGATSFWAKRKTSYRRRRIPCYNCLR